MKIGVPSVACFGQVLDSDVYTPISIVMTDEEASSMSMLMTYRICRRFADSEVVVSNPKGGRPCIMGLLPPNTSYAEAMVAAVEINEILAEEGQPAEIVELEVDDVYLLMAHLYADEAAEETHVLSEADFVHSVQ